MPNTPEATVKLARHADAGAVPLAPQAETILRECLELLCASLRKAAAMSAETASDLFEGRKLVKDEEELAFMQTREQWVDRFAEGLHGLVEKRLAGTPRQGRRPDPDVSPETLRVLNPFDQEKQAAIARAVAKLRHAARKEQDALDLRVAVLVDEPLVHNLDNPFAPDYVVDAIGASARAMYPNPRIWRPFMERVLTDLTPALAKAYITLNRVLADRGVLPEIKAELRARSDLRPADDRELLPLFSRLIDEAGPDVETIDIEVPPILPAADTPAADSTAAPAEPARGAPLPAAATPAVQDPGATRGDGGNAAAMTADGPVLDVPLPPTALAFGANAPATRAAVAATASAWPTAAPPPPARHQGADASGFPSLDPMLALGSSSPVFDVLAQWQQFDPENDRTREVLRQRGVDVAALPLNRVPYIRVAMANERLSSTDKITMDVISLLFDYIFRDPSIAESSRGIFGRLQVPVLKAALLERTFFSDRRNAARRVLDHLAAAAAGAASDKAYRVAFEGVATRVVDAICSDFMLDLAVFERADGEVLAFLERENRATAGAINDDIEAALDAEARDTDRAQARALVRDRLAGLHLPLDVRLFVETTWADYLTLARREHGEQSEAHRGALQTLDDLLWSITAKERSAQKARLTRMVPGIVGRLRKGCTVVGLTEERDKAFFDALYQLHIAAIKPAPAPLSPAVVPAASAAASVGAASGGIAPAAPAGAGVTPAAPAAAPGTGAFAGTDNYHDYVSEMVVGTWLAFRSGDEWQNARLAWVSPLRTKYIFTSRARTTAIVHAPEELAWLLGVGKARLVVEPVPLFDRAVSAALDSIAARKTAAAAQERSQARPKPRSVYASGR